MTYWETERYAIGSDLDYDHFCDHCYTCMTWKQVHILINAYSP
jgi:hypothetical protein